MGDPFRLITDSRNKQLSGSAESSLRILILTDRSMKALGQFVEPEVCSDMADPQ